MEFGRCDMETIALLNQVMKPERSGKFLQNAQLQCVLCNNSRIVQPFINAFDEPGVLPELTIVVDELKELLRSSRANVSSLRTILDKLNTDNIGKGVNFIRPDDKTFAASTARELGNLEQMISTLGVKSVVVMENEHLAKLEDYEADTFNRLFRHGPITRVLRDDGEPAGDLYSIPKASESSVLVTGSTWRINAPDTPYDKTDRSSFYEVGVKERVEKTANLFALQSVLMEAGVPGLDREVVECTQKQCTAFLMQVEGPSGDIEQNKAVGSVNDTIHNNTFDGYHTGSELQAGVASVANILAGAGSRMDPSLVPALILLLGARDFAKVMEMLGYPINLHDFGASMEQFRKEQGNLGRKVVSQQTKDLISIANTGKVKVHSHLISAGMKAAKAARQDKARSEGKLIQVYSTSLLCGHNFEVDREKFASGHQQFYFSCPTCRHQNTHGSLLTAEKYNEWLQFPWYQCQSCQGFRRVNPTKTSLTCRNKECKTYGKKSNISSYHWTHCPNRPSHADDTC